MFQERLRIQKTWNDHEVVGNGGKNDRKCMKEKNVTWVDVLKMCIMFRFVMYRGLENFDRVSHHKHEVVVDDVDCSE